MLGRPQGKKADGVWCFVSYTGRRIFAGRFFGVVSRGFLFGLPLCYECAGAVAIVGRCRRRGRRCGVVSTSGACAVVCLRRVLALAVMMSGGVAGLTCGGIGSPAGRGSACAGAVALCSPPVALRGGMLAGHGCGGSPCGDDVPEVVAGLTCAGIGSPAGGGGACAGVGWPCSPPVALRGGMLAGHGCGGGPCGDDVPEAWQGSLARGGGLAGL